MKIEPSGVVMIGECTVKTEKCVAPRTGAITAVWAPPGQTQLNVCSACLEERIRRGEWQVEGARVAS